MTVKTLAVEIASWAMKNGGDGAHERPGLFVARTEPVDTLGALQVRCNPHPERTDDLDPYTFEVTSDKTISICLCTPLGGTMIGFNEDALIEHFRGQP